MTTTQRVTPKQISRLGRAILEINFEKKHANSGVHTARHGIPAARDHGHVLRHHENTIELAVDGDLMHLDAREALMITPTGATYLAGWAR